MLTRTYHILRITSSLAIALALALTALPTPAQAAGVCLSYYTVQEGDTTPRIAHSYGIKWRQIAEANNMKPPYKIKTGDVLCVPAEGGPSNVSETVASSSSDYAVSVVNALISVKIRADNDRYIYTIKVRDGNASIGGWYKLDTVKIKKNDTYLNYFSVPKELRSSLYLQVCLKDNVTDDLTCKTVLRAYT
jgi:murein DD-endopeptidase MepM/ murein hydrolase activator NlpD